MNATTDAGASSLVVQSHRNWWKVGFFVALVAFELTRELLVVTEAQGATPNTQAFVFSHAGYVSARGSWKRIDGGGSLVPGTVTIECRRDTSQCIEASVTINDEYVHAPEVSYFDATFTPEAVAYVNDVPDCAKYSVRIDLELKKAFAVRQKKPNATNDACGHLEDRIEMQIANGYDTHMDKHDPLKGRFVPLLQIMRALID